MPDTVIKENKEIAGLNPQEVLELIIYIRENNSREKMYENLQEKKLNRKTVKYFNIQFDTRTSEMWAIDFHGVCGDIDKTFMTEEGYDFKKEIYKWLDEPRKY